MKKNTLKKIFLWSKYVKNGRSIDEISRQTFYFDSKILPRLKRLAIPQRAEEKMPKHPRGQLG